MKYFFLWALPFCFLACNNNDDDDNGSTVVNRIPAPANLSFSILKAYPHDTSSYTQGLQYVNGFLYEGTGMNEKSFLKKVDLISGKELQKHKLSNEYFGEGITILNNKIYQITWQNKKGFVYNLSDFKLLKEFSYNTDGWGLTNDGKSLIVSDGSNLIYFWDPETFKEVKRISVQDNAGLRNNINELELINGFLYANVYQTDEILKIDTATGNVVARIDFSSLKNSYPELAAPPSDVLNGIAWDSINNRIFITGKNWSKLFEVRLN